MRYNKIRKMDIANGPGIRVSIFVQGCTFNCKGCFNPTTHDFNGGEEFTDKTIKKILELGEQNYIVGLSILGGEPMHPKNRNEVFKLIKAWKQKFSNKNIWVWTGFLFDRDLKDIKDIKNIDVIVDGQFKLELRNLSLQYKGSSNQRVIDVQKSLDKKEVVLYTKG